MKTRLSLLSVIVVGMLLVGCSTVDSRISSHQAAFNSWPPEVQQRVSEGRVDVGFTREQVSVALGKPDRVFTRTAQTGSYEVWSYADRGPRFGIGLGLGSFHGRSAYGGGISMATGADYPDEKLRVIFDQSGRVSSIEEVRRGR